MIDLEYLLWLQSLREAWGLGVEKAFAALSDFAVHPAIMIVPCVFFWCVNKRLGFFVLSANAACNTINQFIKTTVCCYRPWIRDSRIVCSPLAIEGAGGYSFPSGHTITAGTTAGAFAWAARKEHKAIAILLVVYVLLVMFSRNFLGCHTPQDVLVGAAEAFLVVAFFQRGIDWAEEKDRRDLFVLLGTIALMVLFAAYTVLKPYPIDYDEAGKILADPLKMQRGNFTAIAQWLVVVLAWFIDRRFIRFSTDDLQMRTRMLRAVIGIALCAVTVFVLKPFFRANIANWNIERFTETFVMYAVALIGVPALFKLPFLRK